MDEKTERLVPKSYRLPAGLVEVIERLVELRVLGTNETAVVRTLLTNAIQDLTEKEFVRKHLDSLALLKKQGTNPKSE
jgi:hypothetical protein